MLAALNDPVAKQLAAEKAALAQAKREAKRKAQEEAALRVEEEKKQASAAPVEAPVEAPFVSALEPLDAKGTIMRLSTINKKLVDRGTKIASAKAKLALARAEMQNGDADTKESKEILAQDLEESILRLQQEVASFESQKPAIVADVRNFMSKNEIPNLLQKKFDDELAFKVMTAEEHEAARLKAVAQRRAAEKAAKEEADLSGEYTDVEQCNAKVRSLKTELISAKNALKFQKPAVSVATPASPYEDVANKLAELAFKDTITQEEITALTSGLPDKTSVKGELTADGLAKMKMFAKMSPGSFTDIMVETKILIWDVYFPKSIAFLVFKRIKEIASTLASTGGRRRRTRKRGGSIPMKEENSVIAYLDPLLACDTNLLPCIIEKLEQDTEGFDESEQESNRDVIEYLLSEIPDYANLVDLSVTKDDIDAALEGSASAYLNSFSTRGVTYPTVAESPPPVFESAPSPVFESAPSPVFESTPSPAELQDSLTDVIHAVAMLTLDSFAPMGNDKQSQYRSQFDFRDNQNTLEEILIAINQQPALTAKNLHAIRRALDAWEDTDSSKYDCTSGYFLCPNPLSGNTVKLTLRLKIILLTCVTYKSSGPQDLVYKIIAALSSRDTARIIENENREIADYFVPESREKVVELRTTISQEIYRQLDDLFAMENSCRNYERSLQNVKELLKNSGFTMAQVDAKIEELHAKWKAKQAARNIPSYADFRNGASTDTLDAKRDNSSVNTATRTVTRKIQENRPALAPPAPAAPTTKPANMPPSYVDRLNAPLPRAEVVEPVVATKTRAQLAEEKRIAQMTQARKKGKGGSRRRRRTRHRIRRTRRF